VRFAYLCHIVGGEFVFLFFYNVKLYELGVQVAYIDRSAVTRHKLDLLKFPLRSSCSERTEDVFVLLVCFCWFPRSLGTLRPCLLTIWILKYTWSAEPHWFRPHWVACPTNHLRSRFFLEADSGFERNTEVLRWLKKGVLKFGEGFSNVLGEIPITYKETFGDIFWEYFDKYLQDIWCIFQHISKIFWYILQNTYGQRKHLRARPLPCTAQKHIPYLYIKINHYAEFVAIQSRARINLNSHSNCITDTSMSVCSPKLSCGNLRLKILRVKTRRLHESPGSVIICFFDMNRLDQ